MKWHFPFFLILKINLGNLLLSPLENQGEMAGDDEHP